MQQNKLHEVAQGSLNNFGMGLASTETWSTGPDIQTKHHPKDVDANMFDNIAVY